MKALIHLDQNGKKVMERRVHDAVMKERADQHPRSVCLGAVHAPMRPAAVHRAARFRSL